MTLDLISLVNAVLAAITSAGLIAGARWARRTTRALDRLTDVITPPDAPSMRVTVADHEKRIARLEGATK